jgi:hypothetical protein
VFSQELKKLPVQLATTVLSCMSMKDKPVPFASPKQAKAFQERFFGGVVMPTPCAEFGKLVDDEALTRIAFYGLGQFLLKRYTGSDVDASGEFYCVDTTELGPFPVRAGFEKYGARAVFDKDGAVMSIYTCAADKTFVPPSATGSRSPRADSAWDHAKWVWKCSLIFSITADAHLCQTHWLVSNNAHIATRQCLDKNHPIRRALKVFTFNTGNINYFASYVLFEEKGILHRMSGLTFQGMHSALKVCKV